MFAPILPAGRDHAAPSTVRPTHLPQPVCPWNVKFSQELAAESPFAAREFIAGKVAVTLARDTLALDQETVSEALRRSQIKRWKVGWV